MNNTLEPVIRPARESDAETIARFNSAMALETEHLHLDPSRLLEGVRGLFIRPEFGRYLIAEWDGRVAGQTMITYEWSDWRNGVFWWIQSVYVLPEFRNRGIFRALMEQVEKEAGAAGGVCGVRLYVESNNQRAQEVYCRLGFQNTAYRMLEKDYVLRRE